MAKTTVKTIDRKTTVPRSAFREAFSGVFGKSSGRGAKTSVGTQKETATKNVALVKKS